MHVYVGYLTGIDVVLQQQHCHDMYSTSSSLPHRAIAEEVKRRFAWQAPADKVVRWRRNAPEGDHAGG